MDKVFKEYKYANGNVYVGEMLYGEPNGTGKMNYANGDVYTGQWQNGRQNGVGKYVFADGLTYECRWVDGKKNGKGFVTYSSGKKIEREWKDDKPVGKQGCYVATAVYGSYDCPEVWTLRRFRDYSLATSFGGRLFIRVYYAVSPTVTKWFGQTRWFNRFCKNHLDKFVQKLNNNGFDNSPYND